MVKFDSNAISYEYQTGYCLFAHIHLFDSNAISYEYQTGAYKHIVCYRFDSNAISYEYKKIERFVMQELKNIKLRDYQENILNELKDLKSIGLFFGTGSGKTITSLARVIYNNNHFRTTNLLVICPSTIISQWNEVIKKHTDFEVLDYKLKASAKVKNDIINEFIASDKFDLTPKAVVVNYDIMSKLDLDFIDNNWTIILDEAHKIKNGYDENKRTKKITRGINSYKIIDISRNTDYKIILTATPCEKDYGGYIDYYYLLNFLGLMTWIIDGIKIDIVLLKS